MKKTLYLILLAAIGLFSACGDDSSGDDCVSTYCNEDGKLEQPVIGVASAFVSASSTVTWDVTGTTVVEADGYQFKDSNRNGVLDTYEDWRLSPEERAADLVGRMSLDQKAGLFCAPHMSFGSFATVDEFVPSINSVADTNVRIKIANNGFTPANRADLNNKCQAYVESKELGIPWLWLQDPAFSISGTAGEGTPSQNGFSKWPGQLTIAATQDPELVYKWAQASRDAWRSVGIRVYLGPQIDLTTEPRWGRNTSTFGSSSELTSQLVQSIVKGFQPDGAKLGPNAIVCNLKHFPGDGPQEGGFDGHNPSGKWIVYPGDNFDYHLAPFISGFEAGALSCMPYYPIARQGDWSGADGVIDGRTIEQVGGGYNADFLTTMWKEHYGYDYTWFISDWMIYADSSTLGLGGFMSPCHGVEALTSPERVAKSMKAGMNVFGGVSDYTWVTDGYNSGLITMEDIDKAMGRTLEVMFKLGLFENPYTDPEVATAAFAKAEYWTTGEEALAKSVTCLKNADDLLPVAAGQKIYVLAGEVDSDTGVFTPSVVPETLTSASDYGTVINNDASYASEAEKIAAADIVYMRIGAPSWPFASSAAQRSGACYREYVHDGNDYYVDYFENGRCNNYDTTYAVLQYARDAIASSADSTAKIVLQASITTSVVIELYLLCDAMIVDFGGIPDVTAFNAIFGRADITGKLPTGLPDNDWAIFNGYEDLPDDDSTVFPFGYGLTVKASK